MPLQENTNAGLAFSCTIRRPHLVALDATRNEERAPPSNVNNDKRDECRKKIHNAVDALCEQVRLVVVKAEVFEDSRCKIHNGVDASQLSQQDHGGERREGTQESIRMATPCRWHSFYAILPILLESRQQRRDNRKWERLVGLKIVEEKNRRVGMA